MINTYSIVETVGKNKFCKENNNKTTIKQKHIKQNKLSFQKILQQKIDEVMR